MTETDMESGNDPAVLLRAHENRAWRRDAPASEPEIAEVEQRLGFSLPEEYRRLLRYSDGGWLAGENSRIAFYPIRDLPEFNQEILPTTKLDGMLIFADDEGDFYYYWDPKNRLGKGEWAIFQVEKGSVDFESSTYVARTLRQLVERILAGASFYDEPMLGVVRLA